MTSPLSVSVSVDLYFTLTETDYFDAPSRSRTGQMQVQSVHVEISDGQVVDITLRGKGYRSDHTVGASPATCLVWPENDGGDRGLDLVFTSLPKALQDAINTETAKYTKES